MRTPICDTLGIEFPVVAFTHCRDVAAAVSKAGGLGVLGITSYTPEDIEIELAWIENEIGDRPYGIDVLIPVKSADTGGAAETIESLLPAEHRQFVADLLDRYGVRRSRKTRSTTRPSAGADAGGTSSCERSRPSTSHSSIRSLSSRARLGPPPPEMVEAAHRRGVQVAALVGNRQHAERQLQAGVDIIVA